MTRELASTDMAALARLMGEAMPEKPAPTPDGLAHWIATHPPAARFGCWVAEEAGALVGFGVGSLKWTATPGDTAWVLIGVAERARGRGRGSELYDLVERHALDVGARTLDAFALEGSPGQRFAQARGFRPERRELIQRLDLRRADLAVLERLSASRAADGFRAVSLRDVRDDVEGLYAVYASASEDIPATDREDNVGLEDVRDHVLGDPELDPDASTVVVYGGRPVALSFVLVDRDAGVGVNEMTGTLPEFRGLGLARLAKLATIRAARDLGLRELVTENDGENAPMLALNRGLGYRPTHTRLEFVRDARPA